MQRMSIRHVFVTRSDPTGKKIITDVRFYLELTVCRSRPSSVIRRSVTSMRRHASVEQSHCLTGTTFEIRAYAVSPFAYVVHLCVTGCLLRPEGR
jgi:hypothetical protein